MRAVSLLLATILLLATSGSAGAVEVGDRAPEFALPATTGQTVSLSQFRGKQLVLIEFYVEDFIPT